MPKKEYYEIKTSNFTGALAQLLDTFKEHNPSIGRIRATCDDGTKIDIRMAKNNFPVVKNKRRPDSTMSTITDFKPDAHCHSTRRGCVVTPPLSGCRCSCLKCETARDNARGDVQTG